MKICFSEYFRSITNIAQLNESKKVNVSSIHVGILSGYFTSNEYKNTLTSILERTIDF